MNMPILETERVLLRPFTEEDAAGLNEVNKNPEVMRYIATPEDSVEKTLAYLRQGPLADYQKHGFGRHACIDKTSGKLIGFCGLKFVEELQEVDLGYRFLPEYWGTGLATETSHMLMDYAFNTLKLERVIGLALPGNKASIRVLEKVGMVYEKDVHYLGDTCVYLAINRD